MTLDPAGQATAQEGGQPTSASQIESFFNAIVAQGVQPRLREVHGTCQFNLAGAGAWRATITDGMPSISAAETSLAPVDCTIDCAAEDFLHIVKRESNMNVLAAWLQGLVTISGDFDFATTLLGNVTITPVAAAAMQQ